MSRVQSEISALRASLVEDRKYLLDRLEHSSDQIFSVLVKKEVKERHQAKTYMYKESQGTVGAYVDDWQSLLNALIKAVADDASPANAVWAVFDVPPALAPEAYKGSGSHSTAGKAFSSMLNLNVLELVQTPITFIDGSAP